MPSQPSRQAVVVLGMHRSGTSAVAGCLQRLGVEFGPRLMPATGANERGYYEHVDVVNLHDRLLMALDRGWDSATPWPARWWEDEARTGRFRVELLGLLQRDYGTAPLWGIKDPRMCRLLPWWRPLWALLDTEPIFLIVLRDPRQVAASLARREGISPGKSYALWVQHLRDAEEETRGARRHFLRFDHFIRDWSGSLAPLERFLGARWPVALRAGREANEEFLNPGLLRAASAPGENVPLPAWLAAPCELLDTVSREDSEAFGRQLGDVLQQAASQASVADQTCREQLADAALELATARQLARWYEAEWQKARSKSEHYKQRWNEEKAR